ncbi:lysoplasmalogenase family protein [Caulobacter sp. UNC358MFTsu5.1]|uniref:lysoplasmalogenase family protein n=1 Tax=Caulobacter sp. UNC358MFTsu5.1 TaxID=1449049 RepID=UPI0004A7660D|nr:lysoplasmalogenase family protein [Caulobacter sp. UNC358MFTsu5.1]
MSRSNLAKAVLAASVLAGVSYVAAWSLPLSPAAELTWKGLGVGLLAVYAALNVRSLDGWLLTLVMAFGALGDVLLGAAGLTVGALAFLAGHLVAIGLYLRNRRPRPSRSQVALAVMLVPAVVVIAFLLPADRAGAPGVAVYSLGLALMAATAWLSRFPRFRVGIGALMFVVSDLIIFGRNGPWPDNFATGLAVWGLYYFGQLLICVGVVRALSLKEGTHTHVEA